MRRLKVGGAEQRPGRVWVDAVAASAARRPSSVVDGVAPLVWTAGNRATAAVLQRNGCGAGCNCSGEAYGALTTDSVLNLQRFVGNGAVAQLLKPSVQRQASRSPHAPAASRGNLAKGAEREEELAKGAEREEELGKEGGAGVQRAQGVQVEVVKTASARSPGERDSELAKASTSVKSGAAATQPLGGDYGLTFPENVVPTITAKKDKTAGTWSPKVSKLVGHYSMQETLLAGQTEISGPAGNTSGANFCAQVTALEALGYGGGHLWYMLQAVKRHEAVHAKHFGPALKAVEPAIAANLEGVSIADVPGMTAKQAATNLKVDATFQAEVVNAQQLWLAEILTRAAGDHNAGGPTDTAEKTVTEPMRKNICKHAKKKKWAACAACP